MPGSISPTAGGVVDDAPVRADRETQAVEAIPPTLLVAALVLAGVAPVHQLLEPGRPSLVVAAVCGSLAVVFGVARASFRLRAVRAFVARHPHEVILAACVLASVAAASELFAFARPESAGGLVVFLLAAGVLTTRRLDALAVSAAVLAEWFVVAALQDFRGAWVPMTVLVVCAAVIAHVLQVIRARATDHLARAEVMVLEAAVTDDLTGLRNRRGLVNAGEALLQAHPHEPLSVMYLDVDGLKRTNDELGHAAGDRLVRAAGTVLLRTARCDDVVARIGGDEFAVLLPGTDSAGARAACARLERALEDAGVPASVGITTSFHGHGGAASVHTLLHEADAAMYVVKDRRRGASPVASSTRAPLPDQESRDADRSARRAATDRLLAAPGVATTAALDLLGLARAGSLLHLGLVPVHVLQLPTGPDRVMAVVSLAVAVLLAGLLLPPLRRIVTLHAESLMCAVMVVLCAETVGYAALVSDRWASMATVLALISAGGTLAGRRQVAVVCGGTTLVWLVVEGLGGIDASTPAYVIPVVSALGVAVLLHLTHQRTLSRLSAAEARVRVVALTDELTGLPNRRAFLAAGRPLVELLLRRGEQASVLFLDLDGLKGVNDVLGHAAGDRLLSTAAAVLRRSQGPHDLLARLGGDEFTVLVHGCPPDEVPARVAWLESALAEQGVSASIGAAHLPADARTLDGLLDRADEAMLVVKTHRRRGAPDPLALPVG